MKNEHQENGALRGPLILMVPASNLVAVMSLDWLDGINQAAVSAQTHGSYLANPPRTPKDFGDLSRATFARQVLNEVRQLDELAEALPSNAPVRALALLPQANRNTQ
jgi:hypothetical protein